MNRQSKNRSCQLIPFTDILISDPRNYVNEAGEHPSLNTEICCNNIVYNKAELTNNKWLFVLNEDKQILKRAREMIGHMVGSNSHMIIQNGEKLNRTLPPHDLFNVNDSIGVVEPRYLKKKYYNLDSCCQEHKRVPKSLIKEYIEGDEIWYYSTLKSSKSNGHEALILVRNNKIICSPITGICIE
jgi:hypothetical protein